MKQEEKDVLLDHDYDGIEEFDFALPRWWLATFWGGIIFGISYVTYFIFMNGPSLRHSYYSNEAEVKKIRLAYMAKLKEFDPEKY